MGNFDQIKLLKHQLLVYINLDIFVRKNSSIIILFIYQLILKHNIPKSGMILY